MRKYLYSLDYLRGFAAVSVCLFHFTDKFEYLPAQDLLKRFFSFGHFGVEIFFIISGLVIPYSMDKGNYTIQKFYTFLKKRFIRIEPPYLVCVLLALLLNYVTTITPFYVGPAFRIDYAQVLYHIGYLNVFMGKDWLNQVFWTLAIEFQYYLLIALIFPLISHKNKFVWIGALVLFNASSFVMDRNFVFNFSIFFTVGILLYRFFSNKSEILELVLTLIAALVFVYMHYSYRETLVVIATAVFVILPLRPTTIGTFFGNISYSLYLLHFPIGLRLINLTLRFSNDISVRHLMIIIAFLFSVAVSYGFYRLIEKPFKEVSQKIRYKDSASPAILSGTDTSQV